MGHENKSLEDIATLFTHSLADVFSGEDHVAGPTSEAADVPLFLQRQERLPLLNLSSTPSTVLRGVVCERKRKKNGKRDRIGEGCRQRRRKGRIDKVSQGIIVCL